MSDTETKDGAHAHPKLEQAIEALNARVTALEQGQPDPQPEPEPEPEPGPQKKYLVQVGPWGPFPFNIEEPYIDVIHASETRWSGECVIDPVTGLPRSIAGPVQSSVYFTVPGQAQHLMAHWDGEWILDWTCESGDPAGAEILLQYFPDREIIAKEPGRIRFARDAAGGKTPWHMALRIMSLASPLTSLRMYRAENAAALAAGKIYNPKFAAEVSKYDVARNMDLVEANRATIRHIGQIPSMAAAHWGNIEWQSWDNLKQPFLGPPLAAQFALGAETGCALWSHAPLTLGSPVDIFSPSVFDDDIGKWLDKITAAASQARDGIFESDQWERYAAQYVRALIDSGYPPGRLLITTLGNETGWNYSGQYNLTSRYAGALGGGNARYGYGALVARWKTALGGALRAAGRVQNIVYVLEGQADNPGTTAQALTGARSWIEAHGESWDDHKHDFGFSTGGYWGAASDHLERDGADPNDMAALENWLLGGPDNSISTLPWNLKRLRQHVAAAEPFGVRFIGHYEAGSHFARPRGMTQENFEAFVWGERGARVNTQVNRAFAAAFPGMILSNYCLAGPQKGQPWFEGPVGAETLMNQSWKTLLEEREG